LFRRGVKTDLHLPDHPSNPIQVHFLFRVLAVWHVREIAGICRIGSNMQERMQCIRVQDGLVQKVQSRQAVPRIQSDAAHSEHR
jgi:hypothetical protein